MTRAPGHSFANKISSKRRWCGRPGRVLAVAHSADDFTRMALAEFPELAEEFDEWPDLLHVKMGAFARIAQQAKGEGDWDRYARCMRLADELLRLPAADLENALNVSFLEHLTFDGPRGNEGLELSDSTTSDRLEADAAIPRRSRGGRRKPAQGIRVFGRDAAASLRHIPLVEKNHVTMSVSANPVRSSPGASNDPHHHRF